MRSNLIVKETNLTSLRFSELNLRDSSNIDVTGKFKGIGVVDLIVYDVGAGAPYVTNSDQSNSIINLSKKLVNIIIDLLTKYKLP